MAGRGAVSKSWGRTTATNACVASIRFNVRETSGMPLVLLDRLPMSRHTRSMFPDASESALSLMAVRPSGLCGGPVCSACIIVSRRHSGWKIDETCTLERKSAECSDWGKIAAKNTIVYDDLVNTRHAPNNFHAITNLFDSTRSCPYDRDHRIQRKPEATEAASVRTDRNRT